MAEHGLLDGAGPRGARPRVGGLQRDPRPAAAEDVAAHRSRALPRRGRDLSRRRAHPDAQPHRPAPEWPHPPAPRPPRPPPPPPAPGPPPPPTRLSIRPPP